MTNALLRIAKQWDAIQQGGSVKRMHCIPVLHPQTVAAHSYGVAWWCWILAGENPSANLLMAALQHDVAEGTVGDIPSPTKKKLDSLAIEFLEDEVLFEAHIPHFTLNETEKSILRAADILDLAQYCVREASLGNRAVQLLDMYANCMKTLTELKISVDKYEAHPQEFHHALFDAINMTKDTWRTYVS